MRARCVPDCFRATLFRSGLNKTLKDTGLHMAMRWQTKTILLIAALGPPMMGLLLQVVAYWPQWYKGTPEPNQVPGLIFTAVLLTLPLSYVFGIIPSVIAGASYCGILTYIPSIQHRRWVRTIPAAVVGGAVGVVLGYLLDATPSFYAIACAGVAAVLATFLPRSEMAPSNNAFKADVAKATRP